MSENKDQQSKKKFEDESKIPKQTRETVANQLSKRTEKSEKSSEVVEESSDAEQPGLLATIRKIRIEDEKKFNEKNEQARIHENFDQDQQVMDRVNSAKAAYFPENMRDIRETGYVGRRDLSSEPPTYDSLRRQYWETTSGANEKLSEE